MVGIILRGQDPGILVVRRGGSAVEGVGGGEDEAEVGGKIEVVGGAGASVEGGGVVVRGEGGRGGVVGPSTERNVHLNPLRLGL